MADIFNVIGSNDTVTWQAEPATRGTFGILSTCIMTLVLCVWSSIHLNLPGRDENRWSKFARRLAWVVGGLLAPEILILAAWSQRQTAKCISKQAEKVFHSARKRERQTHDSESQFPLQRHQWTMTHSFWAAMGGISIDAGPTDAFVSQRCTLKANGIIFLLKHEPGLIPNISEVEVKDMGKGSSFSKFLACLQAAWFCLSCIARLLERLPLSILELHTFANALCTVIVYILWWRKPLDIDQPVVLQDARIKPLLAYMWMSSEMPCILKPKLNGWSSDSSFLKDPEFVAIIDTRATGTSTTTEQQPVTAQNISVSNERSTRFPISESQNETTVQVTSTPIHPGSGFGISERFLRREDTRTFSSNRDPVHSNERSYTYHKPAFFDLEPSDARRWALAREAMDKYHLEKPCRNLDFVTIKPIDEFMDDSSENEDTGMWALFGFIFGLACYGGLHGLAWDAQFPTGKERMLWRVSVLVIASPFALVLHLILPMALSVAFTWLKPGYNKLMHRFKRNQERQPENVFIRRVIEITLSGLKSLYYICAMPVLAFSAFYIPARGYLVYESFRTLFYLPAEAYIATSWLQYLPHIT